MFLDIPKGELDAINFDCPGNCQECCDRMLSKWLDVDTTASWKKLKKAVASAVYSPKSSMYVCMYVCVYVRMYVCMHVCMHVCIYACRLKIMYASHTYCNYSTKMHGRILAIRQITLNLLISPG